MKQKDDWPWTTFFLEYNEDKKLIYKRQVRGSEGTFTRILIGTAD